MVNHRSSTNWALKNLVGCQPRQQWWHCFRMRISFTDFSFRSKEIWRSKIYVSRFGLQSPRSTVLVNPDLEDLRVGFPHSWLVQPVDQKLVLILSSISSSLKSGLIYLVSVLFSFLTFQRSGFLLVFDYYLKEKNPIYILWESLALEVNASLPRLGCCYRLQLKASLSPTIFMGT